MLQRPFLHHNIGYLSKPTVNTIENREIPIKTNNMLRMFPSHLYYLVPFQATRHETIKQKVQVLKNKKKIIITFRLYNYLIRKLKSMNRNIISISKTVQ